MFPDVSQRTGIPTTAMQHFNRTGHQSIISTATNSQLMLHSLYLSSSSSSSSVVIYTQRLKKTVTRCWHLDQTNTSSTSGRKFWLWSRSDGHLSRLHQPCLAFSTVLYGMAKLLTGLFNSTQLSVVRSSLSVFQDSFPHSCLTKLSLVFLQKNSAIWVSNYSNYSCQVHNCLLLHADCYTHSWAFRPWAKTRTLTHGYHLSEQMLVVIFDLLNVCSSQFDMITIADW